MNYRTPGLHLLVLDNGGITEILGITRWTVLHGLAESDHTEIFAAWGHLVVGIRGYGLQDNSPSS